MIFFPEAYIKLRYNCLSLKTETSDGSFKEKPNSILLIYFFYFQIFLLLFPVLPAADNIVPGLPSLRRELQMELLRRRCAPLVAHPLHPHDLAAVRRLRRADRVLLRAAALGGRPVQECYRMAPGRC